MAAHRCDLAPTKESLQLDSKEFRTDFWMGSLVVEQWLANQKSIRILRISRRA